MKLSDTLEHHKDCAKLVMGRWDCNCYVAEVAQLEAELLAHRENEGDECPLCALEEQLDHEKMCMANCLEDNKKWHDKFEDAQKQVERLLAKFRYYAKSITEDVDWEKDLQGGK